MRRFQLGGSVRLAAILDLYSRKIVGWSMDSYMETSLVLKALQQAVERRNPPKGLIHNSDRAGRVAEANTPLMNIERLLNQLGMKCSMRGPPPGRKADCWDNSVMESFFGTLKTELIHSESYKTRKEAKNSIFEYIEIFYNRDRKHRRATPSYLNYQTPEAFENAV